MSPLTAKLVLTNLQKIADPQKAKVLQRFFKTGPGEYGEGDVFLGVTVPNIRGLIKSFRDLPLEENQQLINSRYHEARMAALLILVDQYRKAQEPAAQKKIFSYYLSNTKQINNWDLVDLTAHEIVGAHLAAFTDEKVRPRLARSKLLWDRRIAMISTYYDIKKGQPQAALQIAELLLEDKHDLIHKAVGWMLREVGKRCSVEVEKAFLNKHVANMPRTMLRYAIEKFPPKEREMWLKK